MHTLYATLQKYRARTQRLNTQHSKNLQQLTPLRELQQDSSDKAQTHGHVMDPSCHQRDDYGHEQPALPNLGTLEVAGRSQEMSETIGATTNDLMAQSQENCLKR